MSNGFRVEVSPLFIFFYLMRNLAVSPRTVSLCCLSQWKEQMNQKHVAHLQHKQTELALGTERPVALFFFFF